MCCTDITWTSSCFVRPPTLCAIGLPLELSVHISFVIAFASASADLKCSTWHLPIFNTPAWGSTPRSRTSRPIAVNQNLLLLPPQVSRNSLLLVSNSSLLESRRLASAPVFRMLCRTAFRSCIDTVQPLTSSLVNFVCRSVLRLLFFCCCICLPRCCHRFRLTHSRLFLDWLRRYFVQLQMQSRLVICNCFLEKMTPRVHPPMRASLQLSSEIFCWTVLWLS